MTALVLLTHFGSVDISEEFLLYLILHLLKKRGNRTTLSFQRRKKSIVRRRYSPPIWEILHHKKIKRRGRDGQKWIWFWDDVQLTEQLQHYISSYYYWGGRVGVAFPLPTKIKSTYNTIIVRIGSRSVMRSRRRPEIKGRRTFREFSYCIKFLHYLYIIWYKHWLIPQRERVQHTYIKK